MDRHARLRRAREDNQLYPNRKRAQKKRTGGVRFVASLVDHSGLGGRRVLVTLFLHGHGGLAAAIAEVVEAGAAHFGLLLDLDLLDVRRVDREHALDALAVADAADGEILVDAAALVGDDDAGENLDALLVTFTDLGVHTDAIANLEGVGGGRLHLGGGNFFDDLVHGCFLSKSGRIFAVFSNCCACRHFSISPWLPWRSTSGTDMPR